MKRILILLIAVLNLQIFAGAYFTDNRGVLLKGYDPVSYFKQDEALVGKEKIALKYDGVTIHFYSEENKKDFLKSPQKYLPQYGGFCAYAMAQGGDTVSVNPSVYRIKGNKIYFFYKTTFINTLKKWTRGNEADQIKQANFNWKTIQE